MHTLITHAGAYGPRCQDALGRLQLPQLARLLQLLSRGDRLAGKPDDLTPVHERLLAEAAGVPGARTAADGLVPWAAHEAAKRHLIAMHGTDGWAWITPCHWEPRADHVEMSDPAHLALTRRDAESLRLAMQPYFQDDGITLFGHTADEPAGRWLAHGPIFANLPTASLNHVSGLAVDAWMPNQPQAKPLRRLQNEMQMLLYGHTINDQRAASRLPTVNAFWVSGTGSLAQKDAVEPPAMAYSLRDALRMPALQDDAAAWVMAWHALDETTIAHDLQRVLQGQAVQLTLCGPSGGTTFTNRPLGAWERMERWLRPLPVTALLQSL